jgi:hypothetical protein
MLVDPTAKADDHSIDERKKAFKQGVQLFRVKHGGEGCITFEVAEQHRHRSTIAFRFGDRGCLIDCDAVTDERASAAATEGPGSCMQGEPDLVRG